MSLPNTKVFLSSLVTSVSGGYRLLANASGDLSQTVTSTSVAPWVAGIADINGDLIPETITGGPGDDDKANNAGRIYVNFGQATGGTATDLPTSGTTVIIDGVTAGDLAGSSVSSAADLNGDGRAEILVGAPMMEKGVVVDAGAAFVLWSPATSGGIDLADPFSGGGKGYAIKGENAGDHAGTVVNSVGDLNGDGKVEILVGATGSDAGGVDSGAGYVVFGKSSAAVVNLTSVAAGTGGFRIIGQNAGDNAGQMMSRIHDLNGDGKEEILIGATGSDAGGADSGAVYVVYGKNTTTQVDLDNVAAGTGGFRITGLAGQGIGGSFADIGDINGDGKSDILVGTNDGSNAYVVFGKSTTSEVLLSDVASGIGGFAIKAEAAGDLVGMSVTGGVDLNRDGFADFIIGSPHNSEGGFNAGAVYVVWGGGLNATVDLSLVSQGIGGAKIVGVAGSLTGSSVALTGDMNGDGTADMIIASPGGSFESASVVYTPASWQPDSNIYGTNNADNMSAGYGGLHKIGAGDDQIYGLAGNDTIDGGAGNDVIDGGTGADAMTGGDGNDTFVVDNAGDTVVESAGGGTDTVTTNISYTIGDNVENLVLNIAGLTGTGNSSDNTITGTSGADTLNGGAGADTLIGGSGSDTYYVDNAGDQTQELAAGGTDTVIASIDWTLGDNVERLTLAGSAHHATGNALANLLTGGAGDDVLDGAAGVDTMVGGAGNDIYLVDNAADVTTENAGGGADTVIASVNYILGANVENLQLSGAATSGTGNSLDNTITGTAGNDTLDGAAGADTLIGGEGDDTYKVDNLGDAIQELALGGNDTVVTTIDGYTLGAELENLTLSGAAHSGTGNAVANILTGTAGNDTLDGALGADTLIGGAGDDTYIVDTLGDVTTELAGGGTDTVITSVDGYILGANVENLVLTGDAHTGSGNELDNVLTGGAGVDTLYGLDGNDTIDGGAGADIMVGGAGDDTYIVDNASDVIVETADGGTDLVVANFDYVLGDNIESARITGSAHTITGNATNNHIAGGSGDDHLDGGDGDDIELGGDGNDTLVSGSGNDALAGGSGDDRYVIKGGKAHIEDFLGHDTIDASEATGDSHIDLSGEDVSDVEGEKVDLGHGGTTVAPLDVQFLQDLTGSFGDDIANVRTLVPAIISALQAVQPDSEFGSSTFVDKGISPFGAPGEWVYKMLLPLTKDAAALATTYNNMNIMYGMDAPEAQIESLMHLALNSAEVGYRPDSARFVILFTDAPFHQAGDGTAAGITTPNNGDAILDGGGLGEDYPMVSQLKAALELANIIPIFAVTSDVVSVYDGLVGSLGRGTTVTLSSDSSNVVSAVTGGLTTATTTLIEDADGGAGNDTLKGNDIANQLTGGLGDDLLFGRGGNDNLVGGLGSDTAQYAGASGDYSITQTSPGHWTIVDNNLANGNEGTDTLTDIENLVFANGTVHLNSHVYDGTVSDDIFAAFTSSAWTVSGGDGNDTLTGRAGADTLNGGAGDDTLSGKSGADILSGGDGNDVLNGGTEADSMTGGAGDDTYYVDNTGDVITELLLGGNDTVYASADYTLSDNIETLVLKAGAAISGTGNDQDNTIRGNANDNILSGLGGNDSISGKDGNDTILGGDGSDKLTGDNGADTLNGGAGNDRLYGGADADHVNGGEGADSLYGNDGGDTFVFDVTALSGRDTVRDFSLAQGDMLELHALFTGYDPLTSNVTDFVKIADNGVNSYVYVDTDGAVGGHHWTAIARIDGVLGLTDEQNLLNTGTLLLTA